VDGPGAGDYRIVDGGNLVVSTDGREAMTGANVLGGVLLLLLGGVLLVSSMAFLLVLFAQLG
jgi:hypothetical protein